jgi:hypothetical protein
MSYEYNYGVLNKYIYGGLLPYPFDAFTLVRDINNNITSVDFFQGGLSGRKVMTLHITYDINNKKESFWSENFMTPDEIM